MQDFFKRGESVLIPNQFITEFGNGIELWIKREDLLHPEVSGNKFRKLKYNLIKAKEEGYNSIITFGGAHSNHIAATAAAGKIFNFKTLGIIRGEELAYSQDNWSPTLYYADDCGMKFEFVSRKEYRNKDSEEYIQELKQSYNNSFIIPEGGTNELAIKGCEEILTEADRDFQYICSSVGTGGTLAGLINASGNHQKVLGFSALKSHHLSNEVSEMVKKDNWKIITDYHFGGYAKINKQLIDFMNDFRRNYQINLDPVYTGKLLFGIFDLAKKSYFPGNTKILAIHTGGLQGINGMNKILKKKNLPEIDH